ncbi:MAG: hypothetical protein ABR884_00510 [Minisyncoccia bacterium]|jgi:hypothetical protein
MGKFYEPFSVLDAERQTTIEDARKKYLAALGNNSTDAPRLLNSWSGRFEGAVGGAQTVAALKQLQKLPAPTPRLANKLSSKVKTLTGTEANRARKSGHNSAAIGTSLQTQEWPA